MKTVKKAQVGDTLKKPTVRRTTTKNYDVTETTYPGGGTKTETKFKPTPNFKVPSVTNKKAKDGMWMQKAAASIKKRGTAGKCTPITKPGCTGRAKALAKTFKKIAKSNKKK